MGTYLPGLNFPIYSGWTQYTPVIPKLYWDVYSAEQRMKQLCMNFDKVEHYLDYIAQLCDEWNIEFTEELENQIKQMWDAVNSGYEDAIKEWLEKDGVKIIGELVKMVFFGLNDEGYFVAYIPDSWSDINFETEMDYESENYGHLILVFDVEEGF